MCPCVLVGLDDPPDRRAARHHGQGRRTSTDEGEHLVRADGGELDGDQGVPARQAHAGHRDLAEAEPGAEPDLRRRRRVEAHVVAVEHGAHRIGPRPPRLRRPRHRPRPSRPASGARHDPRQGEWRLGEPPASTG
jgi:hypothetical protein